MNTKMYSSLCALLLLSTLWSNAQTLPSGADIIEKVNSRNEGEQLSQKFRMELVDRRGKTQVRETVIYRKDFSDQRKTVIFFSSPSNIKGTGFLTFDYFQTEQDDDQWLYLPALRKTRRISAANRGDYFLGTDLTYEDIKKGTKIGKDDYNFKMLRTETYHNKKCYVVEALPKNREIAKELGYGKVHFYIDPDIWIARKSVFWDIADNELKTIEASHIEKIDGIWSVIKIEAVNHKSGHRSLLTNSNIDYKTPIDENVFTERSLVRGL